MGTSYMLYFKGRLWCRGWIETRIGETELFSLHCNYVLQQAYSVKLTLLMGDWILDVIGRYYRFIIAPRYFISKSCCLLNVLACHKMLLLLIQNGFKSFAMLNCWIDWLKLRHNRWTYYVWAWWISLWYYDWMCSKQDQNYHKSMWTWRAIYGFRHNADTRIYCEQKILWNLFVTS